uniref:VWFD domain-containing protein n=1 Tax=Zooxanthella nutricula TaxID=1333877 RepID=A0A7S2N7R8_9DINO|mmetsp:Transcript_20506/g.61408  ORF Transcript_20506/g.61408 Transcript_20506/m.61408 type:complete len:443 (+) Transcript_20506:1-1329(+)
MSGGFAAGGAVRAVGGGFSGGVVAGPGSPVSPYGGFGGSARGGMVGGGVVGSGGGGVIAGGGGTVVGPNGNVAVHVQGGSAGCAGACGGAEVMCCETDIAVKGTDWKYVPGCGTYDRTCNYEYVGAGGNYIPQEVVTYYGWKVRRVCFCVAPALLAVLIILIILWPRPPFVTTTTFFPPTTREPFGRVGECKLWGDPHVLTFDGARPSFYGTGEFWLVQSNRVKIQGRFKGTKYTKGLSATNKVAIGGPITGGQVIEIGTMQDGPPTVDGRPVLRVLGDTEQISGGSLTYTQSGRLPDEAASVFQRHIVHVNLQGQVKVTVYRWTNYVDVRISMPRQPLGQDGACGNFNGNPADDTTAAIFRRIGIRVKPGELLFSNTLPPKVSQQMQDMIARACPQDLLATAKQTCAARATGFDRALLDSCVYDECFGANEHALRTAKMYR